jgi:two-component system NtrC family sensor kinase
MRTGFLLLVWTRVIGSLRVRILIPTGVLFAATLVFMGVGAVQLHGADVARHQNEKAELFSQVVVNGLTSLMLDHGPQGSEINEFLSIVASHRADIHSISLLRAGGTVSHSSLASLIGTRMPDEPPFGGAVAVFDTRTDASVYAVRRPIEKQASCEHCHASDPPVVGWLEVRSSRAATTAAKKQLALILAATALPALFVLIAVTAWLLRREVIRPLHGLVGTMKKAEAGDLAVRADTGRPDELGVAARGFDATLTALRNAQVEVESFYRERMLQADRFATVGELATGLAHEIKNPLAGLSGALEVLADEMVGTTEQKDVISEMQHQVVRLTRIMESLLNFARPPQPLMRLTDLNATLQNVLFLVQQQRNKASIEIRTELAPDLPTMLVDPAQLEQVFLNLCLNGMQAIESGGVLTVRTRSTETGCTVEVEDTGPGIPPDIRPSVFRPFFTTKRNGSGLGLAISARIVADHGGHIDFQCPETGGTVFFVHLRGASEHKECAA